MIWCLNNFFLRGEEQRERLRLRLVDTGAVIPHTRQDGGLLGDFHGLDKAHVFSALKHDYEEFCFCFEVTQSPCLMLASCEIIYVQQGTPRLRASRGGDSFVSGPPVLEWGL